MFKLNSKTYQILVGITSLLLTAIIGYLLTRAGSLTPPGAPADTWHTLEDIYHRLDKDSGAPTSYG